MLGFGHRDHDHSHWTMGRRKDTPIEALVERLGCGVHGECVVRAWVGGSSRTCEPRGRTSILEPIQLNLSSSTDEIYTRLSLGPLLVNAPKAKHRQGLRLVTFEITGTFSRSSVVSKRIVH